MCQYSYYNANETDRPKLYCKLNNGRCIYAKLCMRLDKFIIQDDIAGECYLMNEELKKNIPEGANYVRFEKKGYLYVELEDTVIKVKDTIGTPTNYVYLKKYKDEYKISLTPFKTKTRTRNIKTEENEQE